MSTALAHRIEELAYREADGIEVSLMRGREDGTLTVVCTDVRTGERLLLTPDPAKALDVFYHPYAYAAGDEDSRCRPSRHARIDTIARRPQEGPR
jgi:hypothetical protein